MNLEICNMDTESIIASDSVVMRFISDEKQDN